MSMNIKQAIKIYKYLRRNKAYFQCKDCNLQVIKELVVDNLAVKATDQEIIDLCREAKVYLNEPEQTEENKLRDKVSRLETEIEELKNQLNMKSGIEFTK